MVYCITILYQIYPYYEILFDKVDKGGMKPGKVNLQTLYSGGLC